jgi:hypothetical protein
MNKWELIHAYRNLAESGKVRFLSCPNDDNNLITMRDKEENPALWCFECNTTLIIGMDLYDQMRAVIERHYEEF